MENDLKCANNCHGHDDMVKWRDKIDDCIYHSHTGLLVNLTKVIEGFATVQKVVYAAVAVAFLALGTSILKLVIK